MANRRPKASHAEIWSRVFHAEGIRYWDAVDFRAHVTRVNNTLLPELFPSIDRDLVSIVAPALGASQDRASVPVAATIASLLAGLLKESHAVGARNVAEQVRTVGARNSLKIRESAHGFFFDDGWMSYFVEEALEQWSAAMAVQGTFPPAAALIATAPPVDDRRGLLEAVQSDAPELMDPLKRLCLGALRVGGWLALQQLAPETVGGLLGDSKGPTVTVHICDPAKGSAFGRAIVIVQTGDVIAPFAAVYSVAWHDSGCVWRNRMRAGRAALGIEAGYYIEGAAPGLFGQIVFIPTGVTIPALPASLTIGAEIALRDAEKTAAHINCFRLGPDAVLRIDAERVPAFRGAHAGTIATNLLLEEVYTPDELEAAQAARAAAAAERAAAAEAQRVAERVAQLEAMTTAGPLDANGSVLAVGDVVWQEYAGPGRAQWLIRVRVTALHGPAGAPDGRVPLLPFRADLQREDTCRGFIKEAAAAKTAAVAMPAGKTPAACGGTNVRAGKGLLAGIADAFSSIVSTPSTDSTDEVSLLRAERKKALKKPPSRAEAEMRSATFITLGIPTSTLTKLREPELRDLATDGELLAEIDRDEAAAKAEAIAAFEAEQAERKASRLAVAQALQKADEAARQRAAETPEERKKREDAEEAKAAEKREKERKAAAARDAVAREKKAAAERFEAERKRDEAARAQASREEKLRAKKAAKAALGPPSFASTLWTMMSGAPSPAPPPAVEEEPLSAVAAQPKKSTGGAKPSSVADDAKSPPASAEELAALAEREREAAAERERAAAAERERAAEAERIRAELALAAELHLLAAEDEEQAKKLQAARDAVIEADLAVKSVTEKAGKVLADPRATEEKKLAAQESIKKAEKAAADAAKTADDVAAAHAAAAEKKKRIAMKRAATKLARQKRADAETAAARILADASAPTDDGPAAEVKHKPDVARGSKAKKKVAAGAGAGSGGPA